MKTFAVTFSLQIDVEADNKYEATEMAREILRCKPDGDVLDLLYMLAGEDPLSVDELDENGDPL